jgi:hypothetical protein
MKTWNFIDKTDWLPGEWQNEPDKVQWADPVTGMTCLVRRTPHHGALCGYVGVPKSHPLHGKDYDAPDVDVHGGLTYADACQAEDAEQGICHIAEGGEHEALWWFGFRRREPLSR